MTPCLEPAAHTEADSEEEKRSKPSEELMPLFGMGCCPQQPVTLWPSGLYRLVPPDQKNIMHQYSSLWIQRKSGQVLDRTEPSFHT